MGRRLCAIISIFTLAISICGCKAGTADAPAYITDPGSGDRIEFSASGVSFGH